MCSRRRPLGGFFVALAFAACASFSFAQEAPPAAGAAGAAGAAAPVAAAAAAAAPGAPAPVPAVPVAAAAPVPARREEVEGQAAISIGDRVRAFMNRDGSAGLQAQLSAVVAERETLRASLLAITAERDTLRADRDRLQAQLLDVENALTAQGNMVQATATAIASTVGIPAAALPSPTAADAGGEKADIKALAQAVREAKTPAERMKAHAAWVKASEEAEG